MKITIKETEQNLKSLAEEFLGQVNEFYWFFKVENFKAEVEKDWAENLIDFQKRSIDKGSDDIKNGRTDSHEDAKKKVK